MAVISVTTSSTAVLASSGGRQYYEIFNPGPSTVYFDPKGGTPASATSMQLLAGGYYERRGGYASEPVTALVASGSQNITVLEG